MNRLKFPLLLTLLLCAASLSAGAPASLRVPEGASAAELRLPDGFRIMAELALTPEQQERGLMFRRKLPADRGMLFVFGDPGVKYFWMKNTFIDLDMVFLDSGLKIVRIFHRVPRSTADQPESEVARSSSPASCVLELAAGTARAHRLQPGMTLKISFPKTPRRPAARQEKK